MDDVVKPANPEARHSAGANIERRRGGARGRHQLNAGGPGVI